jgi:hypothetical protein
MKVIKTASGKKQIKMSKKEWLTIGKTAGWMKVASEKERTLEEIDRLIEQEKQYRGRGSDIPSMEEATPEDLDAGYGRGMSSQDYVDGFILMATKANIRSFLMATTDLVL